MALNLDVNIAAVLLTVVLISIYTCLGIFLQNNVKKLLSLFYTLLSITSTLFIAIQIKEIFCVLCVVNSIRDKTN